MCNIFNIGPQSDLGTAIVGIHLQLGTMGWCVCKIPTHCSFKTLWWTWYLHVSFTCFALELSMHLWETSLSLEVTQEGPSTSFQGCGRDAWTDEGSAVPWSYWVPHRTAPLHANTLLTHLQRWGLALSWDGRFFLEIPLSVCKIFFILAKIRVSTLISLLWITRK